jgi:multicomponent Na+:H+ antiporter subunit G
VTPLEVIAVILLAGGLFFQLVAAVGIVRFPDLYCRLHVVGVLDTLGGPLTLLAAATYLMPELISLKLLLAVGFLYMTSPLVGHMLSRAALEGGSEPWRRPEDQP